MTDLSPAKVQAVTVLRALQKHLSFLYPPPPSSLSSLRPSIYLPPLPTFSAGERALVGQWKTYLKWEESNPLEIDEKDKATLVSRVQGVYRKGLIRMRFYSEIWSYILCFMLINLVFTLFYVFRYMAYVWTTSVGKQDEAMNILKAGIEANPSRHVKKKTMERRARID
jgi:cleavage stimulation factor subunit 3